MTTRKQAKAQAARRQQAYEERAAAKQRRRRHTVRVTAAVVAAALLLGGGLAVLLVALNQDRLDAAPQPDPTLAEPTGWGSSPTPPDPALAEARTWTATLSTSQGDLVAELDGAAAPQAVASFVALAGDGWFDGTECHRLTTQGIFVLQCGDPTGTGAGGPTYSFGPIENAPADGVYPAGTIAMARVGGDGNSMGSQFFIVYQDSTIPADAAGGYTVLGRLVDGTARVVEVAEAGTATGQPDGPPLESVIVNEVSVS